jgi:tRNA dimethylallyltransferase
MSNLTLNGLKMPSPEQNNDIIAIVGPTAVGKTDLSLYLASELDGEVISADSRLFYRGMDIGTAKPSPEEQARFPHYMIDIANPDETLSLSIFQQKVYETVGEIQARGRRPILVGGTGQYVWAVLHGWEIPELEPDARLRTALEAWGAEIGALELHNRLRKVDPLAAERIQYQNVRRTVRALEVILGTGRLFSGQSRNTNPSLPAVVIGIALPREELYRKIDQRIEEMFRRGFVSEVEGLIAKGYSGSLPTMSAIGYREVVWYLQGRMTLDEVKTLMKRKTREFVRRQANWFKTVDDEIRWFDYAPGFERVVLEYVRSRADKNSK